MVLTPSISAARPLAREPRRNDIRDLERLIKHAHRFGSRIFITLNTILRDDELQGARDNLADLQRRCRCLIIQDMGLLELDAPHPAACIHEPTS
ncbi:hypothetical protein J4711_14180, partial [Staphylococcus epidermidis]|nr:hypothetical protein [Staphylococcus epidermidis]